MSTDSTRSRDADADEGCKLSQAIPCDGCGVLFVPARPHQRFHSATCRIAFHKGSGPSGTVKSSRRLKTCQSVTLHLPPGTEFVPGERYMLVKAA
jgi:hypothetical protein